MSKSKSKDKIEVFIPVLPATKIDHGPVLEGKSFKIVQVFQHANLACMFTGFQEMLRKQRMTFSDLQIGHTVIFLNTARDYIKVLMGNGTEFPIIACHRFPKGQRLPAEAVMDLAMAFRKPLEIDVEETLAKVLMRKEKVRTREVKQITSGSSASQR